MLPIRIVMDLTDYPEQLPGMRLMLSKTFLGVEDDGAEEDEEIIEQAQQELNTVRSRLSLPALLILTPI